MHDIKQYGIDIKDGGLIISQTVTDIYNFNRAMLKDLGMTIIAYRIKHNVIYEHMLVNGVRFDNSIYMLDLFKFNNDDTCLILSEAYQVRKNHINNMNDKLRMNIRHGQSDTKTEKDDDCIRNTSIDFNQMFQFFTDKMRKRNNMIHPLYSGKHLVPHTHQLLSPKLDHYYIIHNNGSKGISKEKECPLVKHVNNKTNNKRMSFSDLIHIVLINDNVMLTLMKSNTLHSLSKDMIFMQGSKHMCYRTMLESALTSYIMYTTPEEGRSIYFLHMSLNLLMVIRTLLHHNILTDIIEHPTNDEIRRVDKMIRDYCIN